MKKYLDWAKIEHSLRQQMIILGYSGIGMLVGSISSIAFVTIFVALLLVYIRLLEEKELEARFGPDYLDYKRRTPFLLPRLSRRR